MYMCILYCCVVTLDTNARDDFHETLHFSEPSKSRSFLGSLFHRSSRATSIQPSLDHNPETTPPSEVTPTPPKEKTVEVPRCNTNAMLLSLGTLAKEPSQSRDKVEFCLRCGAAVSCLSQLTATNGVTAWIW